MHELRVLAGRQARKDCMNDEYLKNYIKKRITEVYDILEEIEELVDNFEKEDNDDED